VTFAERKVKYGSPLPSLRSGYGPVAQSGWPRDDGPRPRKEHLAFNQVVGGSNGRRGPRARASPDIPPGPFSFCFPEAPK
jgi:hypothetical protein